MNETPWQRARKTRSQRQEERVGNLEGGSKQNNSGRFWRWKRDARVYEFLVEARDRPQGTYPLKYEEMKEIEHDALTTPPGCLPALQVDLKDMELIVVRLSDFHEMRMRLEVLESQLDDD